MTVQELFDILEQAIHDGHAKARVLFDSEAAKFDVHMVDIKSAYIMDEDESHNGEAFVSLNFDNSTPIRRLP